MESTRTIIGKGVFYTALAKYSNIFFSILIGAVLARLLSPSDFGIVAIVTVFVTFFNLLTDFGLGPAVVQNQQLDKKDVSSIFSFSIILGFIFALLFFLSAPIIAKFYHKNELINITHLLSLAVLFFSLQIVPNALLQKDLQFKQIGIVNVTVQIITGAVAIYLADKGANYYALVFKSIINSLLTFIIFYYLKPIRFQVQIQWASIFKIAKFSIYQFFFNFINYFSRNADNILIGKYFGSSPLGYYDKSYQLMMMPVANLTHVITPVLMPVLSKYQNDRDRVYTNYLRVIKLLAIIGFPLSVFLYFSAPEIINILYGLQWEQSIPVFKLLALTIGIQMVSSSMGSIFQSINRTDLQFISGLLSAIIMVSGICYGVFIEKTLISVAYGLIIAFTLNFFQGFYFLIHLALKQPLKLFFKVFLLPLFIAICFIPVNYSLNLLSVNMYISLFLKILVSLLTFSMIYLVSKERRRKFLEYIKSKR